MGQPLVLVSYDSSWVEKFNHIKSELTPIFAHSLINLHHIGSTAVPGLEAKPIIDIIAETTSLEDCHQLAPKLQEMGFAFLKENGLPGRAFFTRADCNLHCYPQDHPDIARHLLFCHWLKEHPKDCEYYNNLKKDLLQTHPLNRAAYTDGKTSFITKIEMRAGHDGFKIVEVFLDHEYQAANKHREKMRLPTLTSVPIERSEHRHLALYYAGAVIGYAFVKKCPQRAVEIHALRLEKTAPEGAQKRFETIIEQSFKI